MDLIILYFEILQFPKNGNGKSVKKSNPFYTFVQNSAKLLQFLINMIY